jgi:hypothetical protein
MTIREKVERLEASMVGMKPIECPIRHIFASGIYAREMTVPAGVTLTGAIHKTCHLSILSKGRVVVATEDGVIELAAPSTLVAQPGAKRAIHALEETVWTTIHATETTDLDDLVSELTESTAAQLQGGCENPQQLEFEKQQTLEN